MTIANTYLKNVVFLDGNDLKYNNVDLYELLGISDALVTDYSSVAIDYMLTDKPIGYTLDDFEGYELARGWSFDNVKDFMPGHHIYTLDELKTFIEDISNGRDIYRSWRHDVMKEAHTYTDGFSERIVEYFGI